MVSPIIDLSILDFLIISFISTTALLIVKTIQELMGHYSKRFSMYKDNGVLYGVLSDIATLYPLMILADLLIIWLIPILIDLTGISFVWLIIISVYIISLVGMLTDLTGCKKDVWYMGDYPLPMLYFNWLIDFWAKGVVFLFLINQDWVLYNIVMWISFIVIAMLSTVLKNTKADKKLRRFSSCPITTW